MDSVGAVVLLLVVELAGLRAGHPGGDTVTEREKVLLRREGALAVLMEEGVPWRAVVSAEEVAARLFPLPTRTVPTVRQANGPGEQGTWYRVLCDSDGGRSRFPLHVVHRFVSRLAALGGVDSLGEGWYPEDQPTVAALLALPLTEQDEDTGEDGANVG